MEITEREIKVRPLGVLETAILSAHMKFFKQPPDSHHPADHEEFALYNAVIDYLVGKS